MCLSRSYLPGFSRLAILVATLHELFRAFRRGFPDPGRSSVACATWRLDDFRKHMRIESTRCMIYFANHDSTQNVVFHESSIKRIILQNDLLRNPGFDDNLTNQRHLLRWSRWGRCPIWSERETLERVKWFCSVLGGKWFLLPRFQERISVLNNSTAISTKLALSSTSSKRVLGFLWWQQ